MSSYRIFLPAAAIVASWPAYAQMRCDCTTIVDSCNAEVAVRGSWIEIMTDSQQCARVDYFIDGQPFVSLAVDGQDRQDWIAQSRNPRVMVQSCQVCLENSSSPQASAPLRPAQSTSAPEQQGEDAEGGLQPLIEVTPTYPSSAREQRIEGHVDVQFTVTPLGEVENTSVTASQPSGVFDNAALGALRRWRYPSDPNRAPQTLTRRIDFRLANAAPAPATETNGLPLVSDRPRNQCVRESSVYNFGEMIEVGLVNACQEPLLVYGCAEGTGRYASRWVCVDSDQQQRVLVPPADARLGRNASITTAEGAQTYTYADSFVVSRAPNSQYWWVACRISDGGCQQDARQWARAVDRQPATVDPQGRTELPVGRSR